MIVNRMIEPSRIHKQKPWRLLAVARSSAFGLALGMGVLIRRPVLGILAWAILLCIANFGAPALAQVEVQRPPSGSENKDKDAGPLDDLAGKLNRKAINDTDEDLMDGLMRLMGEVSERLQTRFDPSEQTQTIQRAISEKLDEAIKVAASRRRMRTIDSNSRGPDKRKLPSAAKAGEPSRTRTQSDVSDSSSSEAPSSITETQTPTTGGEFHDVRRAWGNLPQREREELIQGVDEEFLENYRMWIERYYRSLQESDQ